MIYCNCFCCFFASTCVSCKQLIFPRQRQLFSDVFRWLDIENSWSVGRTSLLHVAWTSGKYHIMLLLRSRHTWNIVACSLRARLIDFARISWLLILDYWHVLFHICCSKNYECTCLRLHFINDQIRVFFFQVKLGVSVTLWWVLLMVWSDDHTNAVLPAAL